MTPDFLEVNVSLDTLQRERFKTLTHRDRISDVFEGLAAAQVAGLKPIKINAVLMRGINDDEAPALLKWAISENFLLRFIEQMPLDAGGIWDRSTMVTSQEIHESLSEHFSLSPIESRGSAPARRIFD